MVLTRSIKQEEWYSFLLFFVLNKRFSPLFNDLAFLLRLPFFLRGYNETVQRKEDCRRIEHGLQPSAFSPQGVENARSTNVRPSIWKGEK